MCSCVFEILFLFILLREMSLVSLSILKDQWSKCIKSLTTFSSNKVQWCLKGEFIHNSNAQLETSFISHENSIILRIREIFRLKTSDSNHFYIEFPCYMVRPIWGTVHFLGWVGRLDPKVVKITRFLSLP